MEVMEARRGFWLTIRESLAGGHRDYTEGPIGYAILMLAIPMVLELCLESVFAVVDVFFVVRLGADAVATVALTESMLVLIYAVAMGLSVGAMAIVARRIGEKDGDGAARAAVQAILLGVLVAVPVGVVRRGVCAGIAAVHGRVAGRRRQRVVHHGHARRQRRDHDAVSHQRGVPGRGRRGDRDARAVDRQRDQHLSRSVPDLRPRSVSEARHHRRRGGDDDGPRHRRARAAVRAVAAARAGHDPARAPAAGSRR